MKKYFPINTETACQLKWNWSTVYLNNGRTRSCHRTAESQLTEDTFGNFHNTEVKISDRKAMLDGEWPESNCGYCRKIEESGGYSDRMLQSSIPDMSPPELETDPTAVVVNPTILEIYFSNACNQKCVYCCPRLSSKINDEYTKFGTFKHGSVNLEPMVTSQWRTFTPLFWEWLPLHISELKRIQIVGGEGLLQPEFDSFLDTLEHTPASQCEVNIISNLNVPTDRVIKYVERFKRLVAKRKVKCFSITASIDCWGPEQEFVRYGMDLSLWQQNFEYLLSQKWLRININQTISPLTIKTMPDLIEKINVWKTVHPIGHWFGEVDPDPIYLKATIFGPGVFDDDFEKVLSLMKQETEEERNAHKYMQGIARRVKASTKNDQLIGDLFVFLDEMDRRRGTDWRSLFPWLDGLGKNVV